MGNEVGNLVIRLLRKVEVATRLGVSTKTVERMIDRGELVVVKFGGNVRVPLSSFEDFVKLHTR